MPTSQTERLHLFEVARRELDDAAATTLMNLLVPDPDRLATKDDLALTTADLRTEIANVRTEMADVRTEMADVRTEMEELRTEMQTMRGDLLDKLNEQTRTLMLANVGMWLSVVALVLGLRFT